MSYGDFDPTDEDGRDDRGFLWCGPDGHPGPHFGGHNISYADGHAKWAGQWNPSIMTRDPKG